MKSIKIDCKQCNASETIEVSYELQDDGVNTFIKKCNNCKKQTTFEEMIAILELNADAEKRIKE